MSGLQAETIIAASGLLVGLIALFALRAMNLRAESVEEPFDELGQVTVPMVGVRRLPDG